MTSTRPFVLGGFIAGFALAGLGIALAPKVAEPAPTSTTVVAGITAPDTGAWWFSPDETVVGPTAILPIEFVVDDDDGDLVFRYETRDIAPQAIGRMLTLQEANPFFGTPPEDPIIAPERWVLETVNGEIGGLTSNTGAPSARFDVPDGFVIGTITGLRLEAYRMRLPYVFDLDVRPVAGTTYELDEGFSFTILRVLEQSSSTIVQIDYLTPSDEFTAGEPTPVIISGVGPEWLSTNQRQAGGVFGGLQLIREGGALPDTVTLQVRTTYWVPFETTTTIDLRGMRIG